MAVTVDPAKAHLLSTVANDKAGFWSAAIDAAGKRLFVGGTDFQIHVYDLPAVQPARFGPLMAHQSYVTALAYVPAQQLLVSGGFDKQLVWWKPAVQAAPVRQVAAGGLVNRLAAAPDGTTVAAATDDLAARLWETASGKLVREFKGGHPPRTFLDRNNTVYSVAFSPDGKRLATGDRAGTVCLWEVASGKLLHQAPAPAFYSYGQTLGGSEYEWGGIRALAFSPDGGLVVAGGMGPADQNSAGIDGAMRLEIFDAASGKSVAAFLTPGFKGLLNSMFFHPDGTWLIAGGGGGQAGSAGLGSLCLWNAKERDKAGKMVPPAMLKSVVVAREVLLSTDGSLLVAGMQRDLTAGRIEVWDLSGTIPATAPAVPPKPPAKK